MEEQILTEKEIEKLNSFCNKIILETLPLFLNPKTKGSNFLWEVFPKIIKETSLIFFDSIKIPKKKQSLAKQYVEHTSEHLAENFICYSGLI